MSGEVSASKRPSNSLLETDLDFQMAQRLPEPITEETTMQLEDLIKKRIIDEIWDDPERKEEPKQKTFRPKKELSAEKSQLGLAELYEREYVAKAIGQESDKELNDELNEKHQEIAQLFAELNHKLDALSNFHFTPKPHVEELKVVTKAPAISMEEVLPMGVSTEAAVAPQENFQSKAQGMPTERSEMSKEERKTKRNMKKSKFRKRKAAKERQEKVVAKTDRRKATEIALKQAKQSKHVQEGNEVDNTDYSKSAAFFAKIQADQQGGNISESGQKKRRRKGSKSAHLKL